VFQVGFRGLIPVGETASIMFALRFGQIDPFLTELARNIFTSPLYFLTNHFRATILLLSLFDREASFRTFRERSGMSFSVQDTSISKTVPHENSVKPMWLRWIRHNAFISCFTNKIHFRGFSASGRRMADCCQNRSLWRCVDSQRGFAICD
jgi:hypothetical protein